MDLVTDRVLESIVTSWQTREKSHRVHEHSVSNNFCKTTVLKKENNNKTLKLRSTVFYCAPEFSRVVCNFSREILVGESGSSPDQAIKFCCKSPLPCNLDSQFIHF